MRKQAKKERTKTTKANKGEESSSVETESSSNSSSKNSLLQPVQGTMNGIMTVSTASRLAGRHVRVQNRRMVQGTSTTASRLVSSHDDESQYNSNSSHTNTRCFSFLSSSNFHSYAPLFGDRRRDEQHKQPQPQPQPQQEEPLKRSNVAAIRAYHATVPSERGVALIMGLGTLSATAFAGSAAIKSYREWKASQPTAEEWEAIQKKEAEERAAQQEQEQANSTQQDQTKQTEKNQDPDRPRENIFKEWFGVGVGASYYQGGFEDTMTKREAALILGVRESSSAKKIKDAHRRLLVLNHPDTGGSTFVAGKINEAKELLLKGKRS